MKPIEYSHSVKIEVSGTYSEIYGSEWLDRILKTELDQQLLIERKKFLNRLKPLTNIFEKEWVGMMTLTVGDSYSEAFGYRHPSAATTEVSFLLSDGQIQQTDVQITQCANFELLDYTNQYLSKNAYRQTEGIPRAYVNACKNIIKHYGNDCSIARVVDPSYLCFCITSRDNQLLAQSILTPSRQNDEAIQQFVSF